MQGLLGDRKDIELESSLGLMVHGISKMCYRTMLTTYILRDSSHARCIFLLVSNKPGFLGLDILLSQRGAGETQRADLYKSRHNVLVGNGMISTRNVMDNQKLTFDARCYCLHHLTGILAYEVY